MQSAHTHTLVLVSHTHRFSMLGQTQAGSDSELCQISSPSFPLTLLLLLLRSELKIQLLFLHEDRQLRQRHGHVLGSSCVWGKCQRVVTDHLTGATCPSYYFDGNCDESNRKMLDGNGKYRIHFSKCTKKFVWLLDSYIFLFDQLKCTNTPLQNKKRSCKYSDVIWYEAAEDA